MTPPTVSVKVPGNGRVWPSRLRPGEGVGSSRRAAPMGRAWRPQVALSERSTLGVDGIHRKGCRPVLSTEPTGDSTRQEVATALAEGGCDSPLWLETSADDPGYGATAKALDQGAELVLALGGDGTVRAVLTVLAGSKVPLGSFPSAPATWWHPTSGSRLATWPRPSMSQWRAPTW
jgi:hypothetical protein